MIDPKIETLDKTAVQLYNQIAALRADRRQVLGELVQAAFPDRRIVEPALIEGFWVCPDTDEEGRQGTPNSPTGKCVYIAGGDENCIFCGLPSERK